MDESEKGLSRREIERMEEEMEALERDVKAIDQAYGEKNAQTDAGQGIHQKTAREREGLPVSERKLRRHFGRIRIDCSR